jgi:hypothetical protein
MALTIFLLEKCQETRWELVPKTPHRLGELVPINSTRMVLVKVPKDSLPISDVLPKSRELF